jgi:hypothetical protein
VVLKVRPYQDSDREAWERFVQEDAINATFLHKRLFLSYHGDRFVDRSLVIEDGGVIVALFPAADAPADRGTIVSHPGITFGGLLAGSACRAAKNLEAMEAVAGWYREAGCKTLRYKPVPHIYHRHPGGDESYSLFRMGAALVRSDLSSTIQLGARAKVSSRRKRGRNKALRSGVKILCEPGSDDLASFWDVLGGNLEQAHGVKAVHSLQEVELLMGRFEHAIELLLATLNGEVVAGTLLFHTPTLTHAQYIASSAHGRDLGALDLVLETAIERAQDAMKNYFDFGISTEDQGRYLNEGLHTFKSQFGAGSCVYETYQIEL